MWRVGLRFLGFNTLLAPGSGWLLLRANAINDRDQVTGTGLFHGAQHAFLLNLGGR